ncbi:MAG: sigma-70 family RNA polymerase sigma factor [Ruminococcus sp.]|nr:sigma-70 family RNA polymerase sigma factor [Ruminococcus sp.]
MRIKGERRYTIITIGTEQAERIIKKYSDMIYRIAVHNLKNPADAEDIMQEVCLTLLTKCPVDRDDAYVKHWLIRVTINKCSSFRRQFWQTKRESIDDYLHLRAPEERGVMDEVLMLPRKERNIIYLYYYEKYTIKEIAAILGMNPNTVSSSLQRARKKLKNILTEGGTHHE